MPEFEFEGHQMNNPVELALHLIGGKWKMPILWRLQERTWRFSELRRSLKRVSDRVLTRQLRELEAHGLVSRTVHPVVPPHVDYDITALGRTALPSIATMREWGEAYLEERSRGGDTGRDDGVADVGMP